MWGVFTWRWVPRVSQVPRPSCLPVTPRGEWGVQGTLRKLVSWPLATWSAFDSRRERPGKLFGCRARSVASSRLLLSMWGWQKNG